MFTWKEKLGQCKSIQEGIKLIADLKLTVIKLRAFAKYLGVKMTGCKYLKAEIIRWVVSASLGAWLRAEAFMKCVKGGDSARKLNQKQNLKFRKEDKLCTDMQNAPSITEGATAFTDGKDLRSTPSANEDILPDMQALTQSRMCRDERTIISCMGLHQKL